jgi:CBS domain-containing protein
MSNLNKLIALKNQHVFNISPNENVFSALKMLVDNNIGALVVMEQGKTLGLFTERDYARKVVLLGKNSKEVLVAEIMNKQPVILAPKDTIANAMQLMTDKMVRYILIMENEQLLAIVSIGDLVKYIIDQQDQTIQHLNKYISS